MGQDLESQKDQGLALEEARPELKLPPMYRVILNHDRATQVMLHVHTRGKGVCGVFTYEIAETKVALVNDYSRQSEHPLMCTLEKA